MKEENNNDLLTPQPSSRSAFPSLRVERGDVSSLTWGESEKWKEIKEA